MENHPNTRDHLIRRNSKHHSIQISEQKITNTPVERTVSDFSGECHQTLTIFGKPNLMDSSKEGKTSTREKVTIWIWKAFGWDTSRRNIMICPCWRRGGTNRPMVNLMILSLSINLMLWANFREMWLLNKSLGLECPLRSYWYLCKYATQFRVILTQFRTKMLTYLLRMEVSC